MTGAGDLVRVERLSELDLARDSALWHAVLGHGWLLGAVFELTGHRALVVAPWNFTVVRAEQVLVLRRILMGGFSARSRFQDPFATIAGGFRVVLHLECFERPRVPSQIRFSY